MSELPYRVFVDLLDLSRSDAVRQALASAGCEVVDNREPTAGIVVCDVAIADRVDVFDRLPSITGRVALGNDSTADVSLPSDASPGEVARYARLVGEMARLRRQLAALNVDQAALRDQALRDSLTGVLNRRGWDEHLAAYVQLPTNLARPWAIAIADVDQFKRLNDSSGHPAGDAALREIAQALQTGVRLGDVVARLGGDEFGILLANVDPAHVVSVLERLRRRVTGATTISIGGATIQAHEYRSLSACLAVADAALIEAKNAGRNRVVVKSA